MRRENFELFMKDNYLGLLSDCVYYCWQHEQITDEECWHMDHLLHLLFAKYSGIKE